MTSRWQKQDLERRFQSGELPMPTGRFERVAGHSNRVRCVMCGRVGLGLANPTPWSLSPWQVDCLLDHPVPCRCGLRFHSSTHLAQHVRSNLWPERALMHGPVWSPGE